MKEFSGFRDKLKGEDDEVDAPFRALEKSAVLQDCRKFNDQAYVTRHPKRCCQMITKLLVLLTRGERFSSTEVSDVFFGVTKLFQSKDGNLRRMVYLFLKEVAEATAADEIIIVVQSLCKDMNHEKDLYRANAIRVLSRILDASMLGQVERYIKQAIVDKNELVASSALCSGMHFLTINPDVVNRWVSEVQNAVQSKHSMVQYHALALLRQIKSRDRLAAAKLVTQLRRSHVSSPLAMCLLIRYTKELAALEDNDRRRAGYEYLDRCLRYNGAQADMVNFEAARAICSWPDVSAAELSPAITTLHIFLTSGKPTQKFVATRTLASLAAKHPLVVAKCNKELESLTNDPNRTIATMAITTLLRTGGETSADTLLSDILQFLSDIPDEFKVVVVRAIRELFDRFPAKHSLIFSFLLSALREEGGAAYKNEIVTAMYDMINVNKETTSEGLLHLCEFIEDCEYPTLSARVLHILGDIGPTTPKPGRFVRYIYNRVILETAQVRAAAVSALTKFAVRVEALKPNIVVLLQRCVIDDNDEVRDRAAAAMKLLTGDDARAAGAAISTSLPMSAAQLTRALHAYQLRPAPGAFSFDALPAVEEVEAAAPAASSAGAGAGTAAGASSKGTALAASTGYAEELYSLDFGEDLGPLFRSTAPVELTESELEYLVNCVRHVFAEHVVFQFNVTNTVSDQQLENVTVSMQVSDPDNWEDVAVITAPVVKCNQPAPVYVCVRRTDPTTFGLSSFSCSLMFVAKEVDVATGTVDEDGYDEDYELEDMTLGPADFMKRVNTPIAEFKSMWDSLKADAVIETFKLDKTVGDAVTSVAKFLGMKLCDGTGSVPPGATQHNALLSGVFLGGAKVIARMQVIAKGSTACKLKLGVCSTDPAIAAVVASCIA